MIETSSQKNYLVLIQNFWIHLFVKKKKQNHGGFPWQFSEHYYLWTIHYFNSVLFLYNYPNYIFVPSNEDIWIALFSGFLCAWFCARFEPNLHQPSDLWSILEQRHLARLDVPHKIPLHIFSDCAKYPVAGESDFTPSCQGGVAVIVSTAPFSCTLLFVICSLIFGTTAIRTWFCDCSSVVWRISSWANQSSGCADRSRFSSRPGSGVSLNPHTWFISGVTLSKWDTELDGFQILKTKPLWFSWGILHILIMWVESGMKYSWDWRSKGGKMCQILMLLKEVPIDLKLFQIIARIMDAEINYGPFQKEDL